MDREEILRRSRAEKEDEGNTYLENRGRRAGFYGLCAMYIVLLAFNCWAEQPSESVLALFTSYLAAESWGQYRAGGHRVFLILSLLLAGAALLNLAVYVRGVLG